MAVLEDKKASGAGYHLFEVPEGERPPKGTFLAKIIDIKDVYGVERRKFEDPSQMEKVDLTSFLFGFRDKAGNKHIIDSRPMKISGNEKSALFAFLKSILGESPKMGWDYMELRGREVLVTVEHATSPKGTEYAAIAAVSPVPDSFEPAATQAVQAPVSNARPAASAAPAAKQERDPIPF